MSESPYAIPVEDLIDSARVEQAQQVIEQPDPRRTWGDGGSGPLGDGLVVDDGDC